MAVNVRENVEAENYQNLLEFSNDNVEIKSDTAVKVKFQLLIATF